MVNLNPAVSFALMTHVPYADGQKGRDSFQDFGNDSGNEGGMGDFVGFDGDWAGEDGAGDTQDPFSNDLVAAPRKVSTIPYSQFVYNIVTCRPDLSPKIFHTGCIQTISLQCRSRKLMSIMTKLQSKLMCVY